MVASEGAAVALAAGYYLATRKIALVYVQNSGLANALNPMQSVAAKEVFGIPMLLVIGWRGKPGEKDEPQHALIGPHLLDNLTANDFPFEEVPDSLVDAKATVSRLVAKAEKSTTPVALIVPRKTFAEYSYLENHSMTNGFSKPRYIASDSARATRWLLPVEHNELPLSRELVIRHTVDFVNASDATVTSLGGSSRELYMIRKDSGESLGQNFFCIGGMGHSFALAHGLAVGSCPEGARRIWCIDGDGSFIMHLGNNAILAGLGKHRDVIHVVVYNGVYSSTGSQPLMISANQFLDLAEGLSYQQKFFVNDITGLRVALSNAASGSLIVAVTNDHSSNTLPRPTETSGELKHIFMAHMETCVSGNRMEVFP